MPEATALVNQHRLHIEQWTSSLLLPYEARLRRLEGPIRTSKEINDPIWQTLTFNALEVLILDSPLLQRLRSIKQLGVVHWVYPGAGHSRFEHSLGIVHQVQRLITAINISGGDADRTVIDRRRTKLLRLGALLHDIGHGVMSHVSENALKDDEYCEVLIDEFADHAEIEGASLSEIAAYFMVGSPSFQRVLARGQELTDDHELPPNAIELIQKAIVGHRIDEEIPLLHELISGPFDADKLDYMTRDAFMAGVPVVTDVARLVQKVRAIYLSHERLPAEIARTIPEGRPFYTMTGLARSGGQTLDELMLGRSLLFDKVYRHQKVRAAEAMVESVISLISDLPETPALLPYLLTDSDLTLLSKETLQHISGKRLAGRRKERSDVAIDLAGRIESRELFVRAFAFSETMPLDPYGNSEEQQLSLEQAIRRLHNRDHRVEFMARVASDLRKILALVNREELDSQFHLEDLPLAYLAIDPPQTTEKAGQVAKAYLIGDGQQVMRFRDDAPEARAWSEAYLVSRDLGYIFSPQELSPFVYIAAEKAFREIFDVRTPESMLEYAKQSSGTILPLKRRLAAAGFYDNAPFDLRPAPERLGREDVRPLIHQVVDRLAGYSGLATDLTNPESPVTLNDQRVLDWLKQFQTDDASEDALSLLAHVRLIGRQEVREALRAFMESSDDFHHGFICPLGSLKDSSSILAYYSGDIAQTYGMTIGALQEALATERPIVLLDDFLNTGNQAISILEAWLGEAPTVDLGEDRGQPLPDHLIEAFRSRRVAIVFTVASQEGLENLSRRCTEMGLDVSLFKSIDAEKLPRAFGTGIFPSTEREERFRTICANIGEFILRSDNPRHTAEWRSSRVLGYGNQAYLVVFPYNTPSASLTCLWSAGMFEGRPWVPLLPRRTKI